jgi:arginase
VFVCGYATIKIRYNCKLQEVISMDKRISIIGAPVWLGQTRYGTNLAPDAIRSAGIIARLEAAGCDVIDEGNIPVSAAGRCRQAECNIKNSQSVVRASEELAGAVSRALADDRFPLILGGDHSIAIGSIAGVAGHFQELGVIWFDAHADINTPETSPSGNIHGMPLAASLGLGYPGLAKVGGWVGKIKPENLIYIGVRDIDPGESELISRYGIKNYGPEEVRLRGMDTVVREALADLSSRCDAIHLSFDLDGIDPTEAPGVGTPVREGVSFTDSLQALGVLFESGLITSAEFVELNPILDKDNRTVNAAVKLIAALLVNGIGSMIVDITELNSVEALK